MSAYDTILAERRDAVALLTLNRPDRLNVWVPRMSEELADAIGQANEDAGVGAIVVTGAGRGFCAGADMEATSKTRIDGGDPGEDTARGSGGMPAGLDWVGLAREAKPLVAFPQKFYAGQHPLLLDLSQRPEIKYVRAQWVVNRWGRGSETVPSAAAARMASTPSPECGKRYGVYRWPSRPGCTRNHTSLSRMRESPCSARERATS